MVKKGAPTTRQQQEERRACIFPGSLANSTQEKQTGCNISPLVRQKPFYCALAWVFQKLAPRLHTKVRITNTNRRPHARSRSLYRNKQKQTSRVEKAVVNPLHQHPRSAPQQEGRGLDPLDDHSPLTVQFISIALMALLLAVLQPRALVVLQHPMLAAEVPLAE